MLKTLLRNGLMLISAVALCVLLAGSSPTVFAADDYLLGPDDVIRISVYREKEMDRAVKISSDGFISFPLLGQVKAEGLTVGGLEHEMNEGLKKYLKQPQVTVFIEEYSSITVSGQIAKPGAYPLRGGLTVLDAVSMAGDFTKLAARNNVRVIRKKAGEEKTITVRVADLRRKAKNVKDVVLQRGDCVHVPESLF